MEVVNLGKASSTGRVPRSGNKQLRYATPNGSLPILCSCHHPAGNGPCPAKCLISSTHVALSASTYSRYGGKLVEKCGKAIRTGSAPPVSHQIRIRNHCPAHLLLAAGAVRAIVHCLAPSNEQAIPLPVCLVVSDSERLLITEPLRS